MIHYNRHKFENAYNDANYAIEINSDCIFGYKVRAMANDQLGNKDMAIEDLKKYTSMDIDDDERETIMQKIEELKENR